MKRLILLSFYAAVLSSCSTSRRVFLTLETKQRMENANIPLNKVQFYNSEDIILLRQLASEDVVLNRGRIKIENGKEVEEIIIPAFTPGVCEMCEGKAFLISFEAGDGKEIPFVVEEPNGQAMKTSRFRMAATESQSTNGNSKVGKINYDGKIYTITTGIYSHLMIEKTMLKGENRSTSVAKGKKL